MTRGFKRDGVFHPINKKYRIISSDDFEKNQARENFIPSRELEKFAEEKALEWSGQGLSHELESRWNTMSEHEKQNLLRSLSDHFDRHIPDILPHKSFDHMVNYFTQGYEGAEEKIEPIEYIEEQFEKDWNY